MRLSGNRGDLNGWSPVVSRCRVYTEDGAELSHAEYVDTELNVASVFETVTDGSLRRVKKTDDGQVIRKLVPGPFRIEWDNSEDEEFHKAFIASRTGGAD